MLNISKQKFSDTSFPTKLIAVYTKIGDNKKLCDVYGFNDPFFNISMTIIRHFFCLTKS